MTEPKRTPMEVTTYDVLEKTKRDMISAASIADFRLAPAAHGRDPGFLTSTTTISPYCVDAARGEVVLVELPEEADLASVPFVYEAQYRQARRVHAMKIESFIALAAGFPPPTRALFLHSTGRCGSTLLTRALGEIAGVTTLSEPDVFSQLAMAGRLSEPAREQFARLYAGLLRFFMRDRTGIVVFKFRSVVCEHADYLASSLPGSTSFFLYRDAIEVARSYARVTNRPLSAWQLTGGQRRAWSRFAPLIRRLDFPLDGHDLMAALWASPVLRYLETRSSGIWRGAVNYADLLARPGRIVDALLGNVRQGSGRVPLPARAFATHSQAGSHLAPDRSVPDPALEAELASPAFAQRIARSLHRIDPRLQADMTLPDSLSG